MSFLTMVANQLIIQPMTNWLTCKEGEKASGYKSRYLQRLCRDGRLKCVLKSGIYLIDPDDLVRYVQRMKSLGTSKHDWRHKED